MAKQTVIVTGGGRGIGRAISRRFAADGARVIAAARSQTELDETRRLIAQDGKDCLGKVTDVCSPDDIASLIDFAQSQFGSVDVLVNNAGVAPTAPIGDLDENLFRTVIAVNVDAVYRTCRAVWPVMARQGEGVILNISSIAAFDPFPGFAAYGAAKAWVNAWTRALAEEGRPLGIRVLAVAPGAVETRMLRDAFPDFPRDQTLNPEDIAEAVFALAQPACRHITGQTIVVKK